MPLSFRDLPPKIQAELLDHWHEGSPREVVGLILDDGSLIRLTNLSRKVDEFLVGFWEILFKLGWKALRHGEGINMIYHSHTYTTEPSQSDEAFASFLASRWPGVAHLIFIPDHTFDVWHYEGQWLDHSPT